MLQPNDIVGRSVHVKQRPGLVDGILSLVLPPQVGTWEGCFLQHAETNTKIYKDRAMQRYTKMNQYKDIQREAIFSAYSQYWSICQVCI